jgi:hypothetical protein
VTIRPVCRGIREAFPTIRRKILTHENPHRKK